MKKILTLLSIVVLTLFACVEAYCGSHGAVLGSLIATGPVTLSTQKITFLTSLKEEYEKIGTWLDEAEDLTVFVEDGQTLVFPEGGADPDVYTNKTDDVDSVEPQETTHKVELNVYDSQNYKIRNIHLYALPFTKIQFYTKKSAESIKKKQLKDAAYAFAPSAAGNKIIIIPTTGTENVATGMKAMRLEDIQTIAEKADDQEFPESGRNLVLNSNMWWELVKNNEILNGQLKMQQANGIINPNIVEYYGIKIHKSLGNKLGVNWNVKTSVKAPAGSVVAGDIVPCGLFFVSSQVFRAGGLMEFFYKDKSSDPEGRAYTFGFQQRYIADFQMSAQRYGGLIYAAKTPSA